MSFSLDDIQKGREPLPPRICVHGVDKIGKSTFGADAPNSIFIQTEDGLGAIDCSKFPLSKDLADVRSNIQTLIDNDHGYKTAVIDTADWLEGLINKQVAIDNDCENVEALGYGKGYVIASEYMKDILGSLNELREKRKMAVIILAHTMCKKFEDPTSESYERYILKLHYRSASIIQEWVDALGFAQQEIVVEKEKKQPGKAVPLSDENVLHLRRSPAFDAGNRYGLPAKIPLRWAAFSDAFAEAHK